MSGMFDPKKKYGSEGLPPGDYLIALVEYERKKSKERNRPYLRCKYEVCAGPAKGKFFYATVSIDTDNMGAMSRLSVFASAVGVEESFSLDDDKAFTANFVDIPFKARLTRKTENGYTNNDIERYLLDEVTAADKKAMDAWVLNADEEREASHATGGGKRPTGGKSDFGDDDIPF